MKLRMLTYNVHKCIGGLDRRYDPDRVRETIAHYDPDIVLLQEVDHGAKRSNGHRQVDVLGEMLGYRHRTWFPNVRVRGGGVYGNAILSRFPLTHTRNIDLTIGWKKKRSVLHARYRIRLQGRRGRSTRTLHVFNMHLGLSGLERHRQLEKFFESEPLRGMHAQTPVVVAGDLNDVYGTLGRKQFVPNGFTGLKTPATFPAYAPVRALDSVYVRGNIRLAKVMRSRLVVAKSASDHLPLIADAEVH
ncbi:MAG: endonuclease/exonuclease/phosphatase family protein [Deltaproteobacteria bacterium]|nr:endonuclease/exonuclease/phosphatase family protein [Deltaproteobacteria bacterium]